IDVDMQSQLYEILQKLSTSNSHIPAAGIVMNPQNGEILAMASVPSYDPNIFSSPIQQDKYQALLQDPARPLFMRVIGGSYPAGSVFKMTVASAALEEGMINDA